MNRNDKEYLVQKIRTQYTEKEHTELDTLKELDARVKKPARVFGYTLGCISSLVMGAGMSLVMTDIGERVGVAHPMAVGIVVGVIGLLGAVVNYPIYKSILSGRRKKYSDEIIKLSDSIMKD